MTAADWLPAAWNGGWTYCDRVAQGEAGLSISGFYAQRHRHPDAVLWRQRLAAGEIARNGTIVRHEVRLVAGVTSDQTGRIKAGELVNEVARQVGGKGGGRADMAQAGGNDPTELENALRAVPAWVRSRLA